MSPIFRYPLLALSLAASLAACEVSSKDADAASNPENDAQPGQPSSDGGGAAGGSSDGGGAAGGSTDGGGAAGGSSDGGGAAGGAGDGGGGSMDGSSSD